MIKDLAELKRLLALCRRQGVREIKFGETSIVFGDLPARRHGEVEEADEGEIAVDEMTPSEQVYFSLHGALP